MGRPCAIVTGAASGIGRATAELLVDTGWNVVAADFDADALAALPGSPHMLPAMADVTSLTDNKQLVASALEQFGHLQAAVLNVGMRVSGPIQGYDLERFDRGVAVNLSSVVLGMQAALPALRRRAADVGDAAIVVTSSISAFRGDPGRWAYSALKAAAVNLVQSIALDVAAAGVRVNAVCPGPTVTGMTRHLDPDDAAKSAVALANVAMRRWGQAVEIAQVIAFLASPQASFVTGTAIPVDGGTNASSGNYRAAV
jgi:meso-butanediol dehydrogenase / (S,S)-butanediol dehydrogenase / diacetyl reductase